MKVLLGAERRARIGEILMQQGTVRVTELSELFGVSEVTVRADLDQMAAEGRLLRDRGGAVLLSSYPRLLTAFEQRASICAEEKRRIGYAAARLVSPNDTIILDAGTTLMEMAKNLKVAPLTVVTNALNVATQVGSVPDVNVIVVGGALNQETISTLGTQAERNLNDVIVQKAFLGTHALELEAGVTEISIDAAQLKQAMIRAARQVILLADSSKWGRVAFARVLPLSGVHTIVTDSNSPQETRAAIEELGVTLIVA